MFLILDNLLPYVLLSVLAGVLTFDYRVTLICLASLIPYILVDIVLYFNRV